MGKRKERRLAALSNAGRRVKLDLSTEPSGDLGGSPGRNEVGGDQTQTAGSPNSPSSSSSGQQPQNPLLLLGQYSDDEVDEESIKRSNGPSDENASACCDKQAQGANREGAMDADVPEGLPASHEPSLEKTSSPDSVKNQQASPAGECDASAAVAPFNYTGSEEPASVAGTSDVQFVGDVSSGWKMVLHAESNQYYYWNIETGETSWEIPADLSQSTDQKNLVTSNTETAPVRLTSATEVENFSTTLPVNDSVNANFLLQQKEVSNGEIKLIRSLEGDKSETLSDKDGTVAADLIGLQSNLGAVGAVFSDTSLAGNQRYMNDVLARQDQQNATDMSSLLVTQCESLLEKLKSLQGSKGHQKGDNWVQKHILEVEVRLFDIKSLLLYGSSLLPFWEHSERQLKRLEAVINNEIYELAVFAQMEDVSAAPISSPIDKEHLQEGSLYESKADGKEHNQVSSSLGFVQVSSDADASTVVEGENQFKALNEFVLCADHILSSVSPSGDVEAEVSEKANDSASDGSVHKAVFTGVEDVDMDVDMEVEEAVPSGNEYIVGETSTSNFVPAEHASQPIQSTEYSSLIAEYAVPPPNEDWIPPPPPDSEHIPPPPPDIEQVPPPPPPDEPTELSYASYMDTGQPVSYTEQYNLTYQDPNIQYYAPTELQGSNFYGQFGGGQIPLPHTSLYYETVASSYSNSVQVMASSVQTASYFGIQDAPAPPIPGCTSTESSQIPNEPVDMSYCNHVSNHIASVDAPKVGEPEQKVDVSAFSRGSEIASAATPSTSATIQAPASTSVNENVSVNSTNVDSTASDVPLLAVKVQSKVPRTKKRAAAVSTSLRSNKKVSSLVDKWKAAKEELNESEEEPNNALEVLEKKRHREIKEWKAQQIASGEAKDNANFQPLGGDWRERVKRRRAKAAREAAEVPQEEHADVNRKPDLVEISKDLPSGWQAYWDDTSKQVFYGNTVTSETTWNRPTK